MIRSRMSSDIDNCSSRNPAALRQDIEKNVRAILERGLAQMDLVTREEFEVQQAVLLRSREKLEALEKQVAELEAALNKK